MSEGDKLDTAAARSTILGRIRAAQARPGGSGSAEAVAARTDVPLWHARHGRSPRPEQGADLVAAFQAQALRMMCTVARVDGMEQAPAAIAGWLKDVGLGPQAVCWPALGSLDWAGAGLSVQARAATGDDRIGITGAFAAVAETGTLVLLSGPDTPASTHLLPETHIAIVAADRIVAHYEDAFELMRCERGSPPRAMNLVSGPSRTADIEQTIVLGAHGPFRVHIVITGRSH